MPTYLNVLNNAILRANLPPSKGNPAAYGENSRVALLSEVDVLLLENQLKCDNLFIPKMSSDKVA